MYIVWGPPDEIESHPTGGTYDRPMPRGRRLDVDVPWKHGGGLPWRAWVKRHHGVRRPTGSGEYHLTMDPSEKDALLHVLARD